MQIDIIEDFDRLITIKIHGYPSVEDYYRDASNADRVPHVRTPLIAVNTVDDPFVPKTGQCYHVACIAATLYVSN